MGDASGAWSLQSARGARSWFSRAERDFLTESESPWVADTAPSGSRKEELVERKASVSLKTAVTEIRVHEQHEKAVWGWGKNRALCFLPYHLTPGTPGVTRTHHRRTG